MTERVPAVLRQVDRRSGYLVWLLTERGHGGPNCEQYPYRPTAEEWRTLRRLRAWVEPLPGGDGLRVKAFGALRDDWGALARVLEETLPWLVIVESDRVIPRCPGCAAGPNPSTRSGPATDREVSPVNPVRRGRPR